MNKGLKAHLYTLVMYSVVLLIVLVGNNDFTNIARYILALGFIISQMGVAMICYIENWYED
jgi:hypothetical protein